MLCCIVIVTVEGRQIFKELGSRFDRDSCSTKRMPIDMLFNFTLWVYLFADLTPTTSALLTPLHDYDRCAKRWDHSYKNHELERPCRVIYSFTILSWYYRDTIAITLILSPWSYRSDIATWNTVITIFSSYTITSDYPWTQGKWNTNAFCIHIITKCQWFGDNISFNGLSIILEI